MKILVSDFDNTFYTAEIEKNVALTNKFIEAGNIFIIATGRPLYLLKKDLEKYKIDYSYLICNDGAVIFDKMDNLIECINIEYYTAIEIFNKLKRSNTFESVYIDSIYDFAELDCENYNGILAKPYDREEAADVIKEICNKYPLVQGYLSHNWLNILSIEASKGNAIEALMNQQGWDINNIYVVGDGDNDLSMTRFKNSYAVKNSKLEFKKKCRNVIGSFSELIKKI